MAQAVLAALPVPQEVPGALEEVPSVPLAADTLPWGRP